MIGTVPSRCICDMCTERSTTVYTGASRASTAPTCMALFAPAASAMRARASVAKRCNDSTCESVCAEAPAALAMMSRSWRDMVDTVSSLCTACRQAGRQAGRYHGRCLMGR